MDGINKIEFNSKKNLISNIIIIVLGYVTLTILLNGGFLNRQYTSIVITMFINIILAVSLNLITGFLGELTLGHAGFMSIGAYTGALITINSNMPQAISIIVAIICGGLMAALFGVIIGVPVLRFRGDYLAIVTLASGEIIKSIINALGFTNGSMGIRDIPKYTNVRNYTLVYILMITSIIIITNIVNSRDGRAIKSIRDNDIAAKSIGIKISKYKVIAFAISAFFAGVSGVIYAHNVGIIKPTNFDYNKSIEILVIVVLGGMGSIKGSIIAAIILTILPEMLRGADEFRMLFYALSLIIIMIVNSSNIKAGLANNNLTSKFFVRKGR
jgi:ABC-type branched-chain amino acid transport system, permease component